MRLTENRNASPSRPIKRVIAKASLLVLILPLMATNWHRSFYHCKPKQTNFPDIVIELNDTVCYLRSRQAKGQPKPNPEWNLGGKVDNRGETQSCHDDKTTIFESRAHLDMTGQYKENRDEFSKNLPVYVFTSQAPNKEGIMYLCDLTNVLAE